VLAKFLLEREALAEHLISVVKVLLMLPASMLLNKGHQLLRIVMKSLGEEKDHHLYALQR
jgi:hypothetical protein